MNDVILRWTIGSSNKEGLNCLKLSVNYMKKLYPNFKRIICHNQLNNKELNWISKIDAELFDQNNSASIFNLHPQKGCNVHWKLYPPRINISSYEIFIDNDIVINQPIPELELSIKNNDFLSYESKHHAYGQMSNIIPKGVRINSGIFGLPKNFNFKKELKYNFNKLNNWEEKFDEQGVVANIIRQKTHNQITQKQVPIIEEWENENCLNAKGVYGFHFVGINRFFHNCWDIYKRKIII